MAPSGLKEIKEVIYKMKYDKYSKEELIEILELRDRIFESIEDRYVLKYLKVIGVM